MQKKKKKLTKNEVLGPYILNRAQIFDICS